MIKTFNVGIKGVLTSNNRVLVLKSKDRDNLDYWDIPGGQIMDSETILQTLDRKLKNEIPSLTSYKVIKCLNAYRLERDMKDGYGLMLITYKIESDLDNVVLSKEHDGYELISRENIGLLSSSKDRYIEPGCLEAIKLALE